MSNKVNIWREVISYDAGFVADDTVEGTTASMQRWSALTAEEIAAMRMRAKKCFNEMFDFNVTSRKVLENVEALARCTPRYQALIPAAEEAVMEGTED